MISPDDPAMKAETLLRSASMLVPSLQHNGVKVWVTLAIGEYLNEIKPKAQLLPADIKARAHCRAICGEMHSGFASMRGSLPMNIKARFPGFKTWSRAQGDIDQVRDHFSVRGLCDAEVAVEEEIAQAARDKPGFGAFQVRKLGRRSVWHGRSWCVVARVGRRCLSIKREPFQMHNATRLRHHVAADPDSEVAYPRKRSAR